ncbi:RSM23 37S ribosomal protein S23 [Candida maltosa Xu316]|uniref:Small ribosomal subunit protein mS29 n=1 Tax=Candida maltosa (strain Xu316) TaxID=1245528 RepID=M3JDN5_CANMX|nr:Mitochondrial ribosomal protein, small subunit, putative [Candida maltosa Xu316]
MLRASSIIRPIVSSVKSVRTLSTSSVLLAQPRQKEGKAKQILKKNSQVIREKPKKTTSLTHLRFGDAVRVLGFETTAPALNVDTLTLTTEKNTITKFDKSMEDKLTVFDAFKKYQHHEMFQNPVTLVTSNTERIVDQFVNNLDKESKDNRKYIDGIKGSGKSTLITQTISLANEKFENDIVVLHLHNADLVGNGSSDYIRNNKLQVYQQPMLTKRWIKKILKNNESIFKKLKLTKDTKFVNKKKEEVELKAGENTLFEYLNQNHDMSKTSPTFAFQFFIEQLIEHSETTPVLLSIDNFNAFADFPLTKYRHPDFTPVHIEEFELGKFIIQAASGELSFKKGGVLLAKSGDYAANRQTVQVGVYPNQEFNPYAKLPLLDYSISQKLASNGGITPFQVEPLTKEEVKSLMTFWKDQGVLIVRDDFHKKEFNEEKTYKESNPEEQFERLFESLYVANQGNPYGMIKQAVLAY